MTISLIETIKEQREFQIYESILLTEDRIQYLKDKTPTIDTSHDTLAIHHNPSDIIDHFADIGDPSKNKQHTQWILGQYKKKNIRQEDMYRVRPALENFDKYKSKLAKKDINQYKTLSELEGAVRPHLGTAATKKEQEKEVVTKGRTLVHSGEDGTQVYRLEPTDEGKAASVKIYGGGGDLGGTHTSWCTAADSDHNMFHYYSKHQPLHVIHTPDGEVYQAHPHSDQLMDRHDNEIENFDYENSNRKNIDKIGKALDHIPDGWKMKVSKEFPNVTPDEVSRAFHSGNDNLAITAVEHPLASPEILGKALKSPRYDLVSAAIKNPRTRREDVKEFLASDQPASNSYRYFGNVHPSLSPDDLREIYHTKKGLVRRGVLDNPNTPKDVLEHAIHNPNLGHDDMLSVTQHPNTDVSMLKDIVAKHPSQLFNVVKNKNATPEMIDEALREPGNIFQYGKVDAVKNTNATKENLHTALKDHSAMVRVAALENENSDESHLDVALKDNDIEVIRAALRHPKITSEHIDKIYSDPSKEAHIKIDALKHSKASPELLERASKDYIDSPTAIHNILKNKNVTTKIVDGLAKSGNLRYAFYASEHPKLSPEGIEHLSRHERDGVRAVIAQRDDLSHEQLHRLINDESEDVSNYAKQTLRNKV